MRRRLARLFLAVALVAAQHGVYAHALSHVGEGRYGHDGGVPAKHAPEICVAFVAASGGAVGSGNLPLDTDAPPAHFSGPALTDPLLPPLALTRFASRAPPLLA